MSRGCLPGVRNHFSSRRSQRSATKWSPWERTPLEDPFGRWLRQKESCRPGTFANPFIKTRCSLIKSAIPVLHVSNSVAAENFYCDKLGFRLQFAMRPIEGKPDPCYMAVTRNGVVLHVSSFSGDGVSGGVVNLLVDDVDALYVEFVSRQVQIDLAPTNQTWGNREMYVKDADGNCLRFIREGTG
jgi:uncharacterized glyoxalase superfamily protein PhnB